MIGPHEGIELELMLSGKKKLAFFPQKETYQAFPSAVKSGKVFLLPFYHEGDCYQIFYTAGNKDKALTLKKLILKQYTVRSIDDEIMIGKLLGYDSEDIEHYVEAVLKKTM
ncbi:hypothetical protein ST37_16465 [Vibrio sp. qd031]|uniref:hypothetical protein n=1 Tax=Vibrio sp. qd031 TaxID=1603038 RepID=UPI000A1049EA|nr:hypothetical protein [Vibrio sp. qd031]ORT48676.1 hypothetical protein ST37_16465 [Vibrio sp. qd031]